MTITLSEPTATSKPAAPSKPEGDKVGLVTLDQLAREVNLAPRDARMLLRLASKQIRQYPNLGKEHVARQPWQWTVGSKALDEARKALTATPDA